MTEGVSPSSPRESYLSAINATRAYVYPFNSQFLMSEVNSSSQRNGKAFSALGLDFREGCRPDELQTKLSNDIFDSFRKLLYYIYCCSTLCWKLYVI